MYGCGFPSQTRSFNDFSSKVSTQTHMFLQQAAAQTPPRAFTGCYIHCVAMSWKTTASVASSSEGSETLGASTAKPGEVCVRRFDILE